jgi:predicted N-acetyltransferase YhbS
MTIPGDLIIRQATPADTDGLLDAERLAFGEPEEAELVEALCAGDSFVPELSLVAEHEGLIVGHILFTHARVGDVDAALLAPLAVVPEHQRKGVGTALGHAGLRIARELGFGAALVLGHPEYYPRFGFEPAIPLGVVPPYPVDPAEAWMALELIPGALARARGAVSVAPEIDHPEMWRE